MAGGIGLPVILGFVGKRTPSVLKGTFGRVVIGFVINKNYCLNLI
jgi:hypothetical protein